MLRRAPEEDLLAYCAANDIGVVAYSPLRSGILTEGFTRERLERLDPDDWRTGEPDFYQPRADVNLAFVERLRDLAAQHGLRVSQLAISWTLVRPEVTSAIVGARRPDQIERSAPAADWQVSNDLLEKIKVLLAERERDLAMLNGDTPE
jgi:aryl-alcohol dehydrogenase-like predicted oxidoreductase